MTLIRTLFLAPLLLFFSCTETTDSQQTKSQATTSYLDQLIDDDEAFNTQKNEVVSTPTNQTVQTQHPPEKLLLNWLIENKYTKEYLGFDLSQDDLKIYKLEKVRTIPANDSIKLLKYMIDHEKEVHTQKMKGEISFHQQNLNRAQEKGESYDGEIDYIKTNIANFQKKVDQLKNPPYTGSATVERFYKQLNRLEKNSTQLLSVKYKITYEVSGRRKRFLGIPQVYHYFTNQDQTAFIERREKVVSAKWCETCAKAYYALADEPPFTCKDCQKSF